MLVMFVGNMTISAQAGKPRVNQVTGYELVPFGNNGGNAVCILPGTNTLFSVNAPNTLVLNEAKGSQRVFHSDVNFSNIISVLGDYNNKSVLITTNGYVYVVDKVTGHTTLAFKALTSFPKVQSVFTGMVTLDNDPSKVYICGCFDSIAGKPNTPKFLLRYDLVNGEITKVIEDQPYEVGDLVKFKGKLFIGINYDKLGNIANKVIIFDPLTNTFSNINKGTLNGGGTMATNGTTLLSTGYKQGFFHCLFQYDEVANTFVTLFTGVDEACVYKGEFYLGTQEFITNSSNETIPANYFVKYNAELGELSTFDGLVFDRSNLDFTRMFAGKDYFLFSGVPAYRLQPIASGVSNTKASVLVLPNPMPCAYSFQVPSDYVGSVLTISSLNGQVLMERKLQDEALDLNLPIGMYILQIRNEKIYESRKIFVR
ncbi:MAG: T9SS type A sorting domain-containing protein [Minisyncoccia bacterium]